MQTDTPMLYPIDECPELMADAVVFDEHFNLLFLSVWGRDTAITAFLARLTLGGDEQGLDELHIINERQASIPLFINNVEHLDKVMSRSYRQTLFGSMCNLWLRDKQCLRSDHANGKALVIFQKGTDDPTGRLWSLVQDTAPFALLDHWRDVVMELLKTESMLVALPTAIGPIEGFSLNLDIPALTAKIGALIREGILTATAEQESSLRQAA